MLTQLGVPAKLWSEPGAQNLQHEPFLCFQRRANGDVVAGGKKILGSAQRRSRGALVQHGSLLIRASNFAPEIDGLQVWLAKRIEPAELVERWALVLGMELAIQFRLAEMTDEERRRVELIQTERFTNPAWTQRR
jgi:lipoate-protein ligase A